MNSNNLLAALGRVGQLFTTTMSARLDGDLYPPGRNDPRAGVEHKRIQDATSVTPPREEAGRFLVEIVIDTRLAPYARAYEWGSGIHSKKGGYGEYPIEPRNTEWMIWPEEDWWQWEDWGGAGANPVNGLFFLTGVMHPGVAAKPYIRPTIAQIQPEVRKILAKNFKTMLLEEGKFVEVVR